MTTGERRGNPNRRTAMSDAAPAIPRRDDPTPANVIASYLRSKARLGKSVTISALLAQRIAALLDA